MASRNKDERAHVNALTKALQKNSPGVYVYIDRDAGNVRHTSSGWDFFLAYNGRVVFCEAKEEKGKLSTWQELTQALVKDAKTLYSVVRFWNDGKTFTVDNNGSYETDHARKEMFFD